MSSVTLTLSTSPETSIKFELFTSIVPKTCDHFKSLCEKGTYTNVEISRIVKDGWLQGSPTSDSTEPIPDESFAVPFTNKYTLGLTNSGPHSSTSGFFITLAENASWLSGRYVGFGRCVEGGEALDKINLSEIDENEMVVGGVTVLSWVVDEE